MTQEPLNVFQFAQDLARLREDLEHAANEYLPIEHQSPAAAGFLIVINELTAGAAPEAAVANAMAAYNRMSSKKDEHERATREQRERDEAQLAAEEEITRKVDCPFCGVQAGLSCVGTGRGGGLKKKSHADRIRLARGLNDGASEVPSDR